VQPRAGVRRIEMNEAERGERSKARTLVGRRSDSPPAIQTGGLRAALRPGIAAAALIVPLFVGSASADTWGTISIGANTRLKENHNGSVVVTADNVTLDCAGFTITGPSTNPEQSQSGVLVQHLSGVIIKNCRVTGFGNGVEVVDSTGVSIIGTHAFDNTSETPGDGFLIVHGKDTTLKNNVSTGNVNGIDVLDSDGTLLEHNRIEGSAWAGLIVSDSTGTVARGNVAIDNGGGLELYSSSDSVFLSNKVSATRDAPGISLHSSSGNTIVANRVLGNLAGGISLLEESSNNGVFRNLACRNDTFDASDDGTGTGNVWSHNRFCRPPL
jgi:parallel beta-helix repeat protein